MEVRNLCSIILIGLLYATTSTTSSPSDRYASFWRLQPSPQFIEPGACDGVPNGVQICSSDCFQKLQCMSNVAFEIENCQAQGLNCYESTDAVSCTLHSQCGGPILCAQHGKYPDPDFCGKYHDCPGPKIWSDVSDCAADTAYNIATNTCDLPTTATVCQGEGPVPSCTALSDKGALPDNPSYYYSCVKDDGILYPALHWCGDNNQFNTTLGRCNLPLTTTAVPSSTADTTFTTDITDPTTLITDPTTLITDPTTLITDPTTLITDPTTLITDPTTLITDPTTLITDPTTLITDPTTLMTDPTTLITDPTTLITDPTTFITDPTTLITDPTTLITDPTTTSELSTTNGTETTTPIPSATTTPTIPTTSSKPTTTEPPPTEPPKDYTVAIAVSSTVAIVLLAGGFTWAFFYLRKRKIKMPDSRKLF